MKTAFFILSLAGSFLMTTLSSSSPGAEVQSGPNHFSLSLSAGLNIRASFKHTATAISQPGLDLPSGGHTYDDGYVHVDSSGGAGGDTWNWGYQNASQVNAAADTIAFHSTAGTGASAGRRADDDPQPGFELTYGRDLGQLGRATWGLEGAFGFTDLQITDRRTIDSSVTRVTDTYSLGGITPPSAPYSGSFGGPGPLLSDSGTRSSEIANSITTGERKIEGGLYTVRLGPFIQVPVCSRFGFQFSGGLVTGIADARFSFHETTTSDSGVLQEHGSDGGADALVGGYLSGRCVVGVTRNASVFAGAEYQAMGSVTRRVAGRSARLDLGEALFLHLGASWSF